MQDNETPSTGMRTLPCPLTQAGSVFLSLAVPSSLHFEGVFEHDPVVHRPD